MRGPGRFKRTGVCFFENRSVTLKMCLVKDDTCNKLDKGYVGEFNSTGSLMLYSFIYAALCGNGKFYADEKTRVAVNTVLRKRCKNQMNPFVVFLDNFPCWMI
ncbi:hypothetical protein F441_19594 [Phytophthora nicotianae CJ01A1]|uniref:Uncharacterized protein n=5 Tax=Phytophthora nicotianae TaxID=4792 RepID=W2PL63_PHYN3|nr:hypothetical protein PPTG_17305 [Phytophthora nicotianae INRA-310]ETI33554.1 hypothetical protein F443_19760 [Phytophthora nicotianae P1569]ETK73918.1 hypothetical protein L915_19192 [Phytophthora nicotianae]ETO62359.1 hypothetical protein F444_19722 [Phytophthora nicotianae P1976]ETP03410.1 hypothetical protein F441_19594 [Phytophthora nicotianae CJ01A1]ETL27350.1 hypothetical protein L916_19086 [Phytophthora nicotianae]